MSLLGGFGRFAHTRALAVLDLLGSKDLIEQADPLACLHALSNSMWYFKKLLFLVLLVVARSL